ncbi:hypothetical protein ATKI12_4661 [Kitasatospora sp. Ki12]
MLLPRRGVRDPLEAGRATGFEQALAACALGSGALTDLLRERPTGSGPRPGGARKAPVRPGLARRKSA